MIDLYFLIPEINAKIFSPTAELVILTGTPTKEAKAEIETQPLIAEKKTRKFLFKIPRTFLHFLLIKAFCFNSSKK